MWNLDDPLFGLKMVMSVMVASAIAAGLLVGALELRWLRARAALTRDARAKMLLSLSALPPNALVTLLMTPVWAAVYTTASGLTSFHVELTPLSFALAFLAADFSYYWEHRCAHKLRPLWSLYHALHHSSDAYTVATAYRVSFLTQLLSPAFYLPWILVGFEPLLIVGFQLFAFHYQAWIHTEMVGPLGALDQWMNTPVNHRMHHSRARAHQDVNMGAVLMVWDRLFGTYAPPVSRVEYGIPGAPPPKDALSLYTGPWRRWWLGGRREPTHE